MGGDVAGDLAGFRAELVEERVVKRPDAVERRDQHACGEGEPHERRARGEKADATIPLQRDQEPEHDHRERDVLFAREGGYRRDREPSPSPAPRRPVGEQQRRDRQRVGVEELPREELVRRVE